MSGNSLRHASQVLKGAIRPVVELLENRQMLSVSLQGHVLRVVGTEGADSITVSLGKKSNVLAVNDNGQTSTFALSHVKRISIDGLGGDDNLAFNDFNGEIFIPANIDGGDGNDTIVGGSSNDIIRGEDGDDLLQGRRGDDYLDGGSGDDRLIGGVGRDRLFGRAGSDVSNTGGEKGDFANGGAGADSSDSGAGGLATSMKKYHGTAAAPPPRQAQFTFTGTPIAYEPAQIRRAYGFGDLSDRSYQNRGQGQGIAIIGAFDTPTARADLAKFSATYGLPKPSKHILSVAYATGHKPIFDEEWSGEALLDIQWAHAIAPNAHIYLVEADTNLFSDIFKAVNRAVDILNQNHGGGVVSMSLGSPDSTIQSHFDTIMHNNKTHNISFVASAGDTGAQVEYPAVSPYVTAVGGTKLYLDSQGNRIPGVPTAFDAATGQPTAFADIDCPDLTDVSNGGFFGFGAEGEASWWDGGGGISFTTPAPVYQSNRFGFATRHAVDLAYNADPRTGVNVYNSAGDAGQAGWFEVGGTSAGAPQIAAMVALANQSRVESGQGLIGETLNDRLYKLGGRGADAYFNDITVHGTGPILANEQCPDVKGPPYTTNPPGFINQATPGFDDASGFGTPNARSLIPALADRTINLIDQTFTYHATFIRPLAAAATGLLVSNFDGDGTIGGYNTLTTQFNEAFSRFNPLERLLITAPDDTRPAAIPPFPFVMDRNGDSFSGTAFAVVYTQESANDPVLATKGFIKILGTVGRNGHISGQFFSISSRGKRIVQNQTSAALSGTFSS